EFDRKQQIKEIAILLNAIVPILGLPHNTVTSAFKHFISTNQMSEMFENVLDEIKIALETKVSGGMVSQEIHHLVMGCLDLCQPIPVECDELLANQKLCHILDVGLAWCQVGLLREYLLAPVGPVDPAVRQSIQLNYLKQE
ncbi:unnamed protein product, partial [Owenia fusiformis]